MLLGLVKNLRIDFTGTKSGYQIQIGKTVAGSHRSTHGDKAGRLDGNFVRNLKTMFLTWGINKENVPEWRATPASISSEMVTLLQIPVCASPSTNMVGTDSNATLRTTSTAFTPAFNLAQRDTAPKAEKSENKKSKKKRKKKTK